MIVVRRNKNLGRSIMEKAYNVYLKLPDGSEHEIPGVVSVTQHEGGLPSAPYHSYTVGFSINDECVKFE